MNDKLKLVKVNERDYINPLHVDRVYKNKQDDRVYIDLVSNVLIYSDYSLGETVKLLTD